MHRMIFIILFSISTVEAAETQYLPFKLKSGDEVIFSINERGGLIKSNTNSFCAAFKGSNPEILEEYNTRFKENRNKLEYACKAVTDSTVNSLRIIGITRCIANSMKDNSIAEMCRDSKKVINQYMPQLIFFSDTYAQIKTKEHQHEINSIQRNNTMILSSIKKQRDEQLSFCKTNYQNVKENDLKGVSMVKSMIRDNSGIEQLKQLEDYQYLSPKMNKTCLQQEEYKLVLKEVNNANQLLKNKINSVKKEKTKALNIAQNDDSYTEIKPYQNTSNLLEPDARIHKDIKNSPEALKQLVSIIRLSGYKCDSLSSIVPMSLRRGFSVWCNNYIYEYEVEDKGGNWIVTVK